MDNEMSHGRRWSDALPEVQAAIQQHDRRLVALEAAERAHGENRMEDFKLIFQKLSDVHEKVNRVALGMWALAATGLGALALLLVAQMAKHTTGGQP